MTKVIYEFNDEVQDDILKMKYLLEKPKITSLLFDLMTSNFQKKVRNIADNNFDFGSNTYLNQTEDFKDGFYEGMHFVLDSLREELDNMNLKIEDITY